jgi:23S rRNA pseudouridine1911/1915/1917 synthase
VAVARHLARLRGIPGVTRTLVRGWVEAGRVRINGAPAKPSRRLAPGDRVEIDLPPSRPRPEIEPREMSLAVVFEDDWLLALDKPAGLVVHPVSGHREHPEDTLLHGLLWRTEGRRLHLVSRLDRNTSGLLLVAKTPEVHAALQKGKSAKDYLAVVYGRTGTPKGRIDLGILPDPGDRRRRAASRAGGRPSATLWERLAESESAPLTLLRCRLLTGRTHQIRVHLEAVRLPIVGDPLYGAPGWKGISDPVLAELCRTFPRQALHAWRLAFTHPVTRESLELTAPPPPDLAGLLAAVGLILV